MQFLNAPPRELIGSAWYPFGYRFFASINRANDYVVATTRAPMSIAQR
jgi:hypothetical protein